MNIWPTIYSNFWKELEVDQRVFPVVGDVLHVVQGVKQEVVPPLIPVNGHSAISVYADTQKEYKIVKTSFFYAHWNYVWLNMWVLHSNISNSFESTARVGGKRVHDID